MTDSRVTPQAAAEVRSRMNIPESAVEAAAAVFFTGWDFFESDDPDTADALDVARRALAAAGPLVCQPLQDENERLRQTIDEVRDMHAASACTCENCDGDGMCCVAGCWGHWPCLTAEALDAHVAAVPVAGEANDPA